MNATARAIPASAEAGRSRPLLGLGNLLRKDFGEWTHGRRPWIVLAVSAFAFGGAAANAAINQWVLKNVVTSVAR